MLPDLLLKLYFSSDVQFANSWLLWLLVLIPVFLLVRWLLLRKDAVVLPVVQYAPDDVVRESKINTTDRITPGSESQPKLPSVLSRLGLSKNLIGLLFIEALLLFHLIVGVAGPGKESVVRSIADEGLDVALVLDISASMLAADFKPNRLESLKELAIDFVDKNESDRIGVIVYAGEVFTQAPLTTDHRAIKELLRGISYYMIDHSVSGGTATGDALLIATDTLKRHKIKGRDQVIILITDGESNTGIDPLDVAPYLLENKIKLYIVGMASDESTPVFLEGEPFVNTENKQLYTSLDDKNLQKLAGAAQAEYYRALDEDALRKILQEIAKLNTAPLKNRVIRSRSGEAYIVAMIALLLFLIRQIYSIHFVRRPIA